MSPAERSGLLALAVLGSGSAGEVAEVAGCEVDIGRLVGVVPLLHQDAQGRLGAHQLWEEAAERPKYPPPRAIVDELDKYVVGQEAAKRAMAVAVAELAPEGCEGPVPEDLPRRAGELALRYFGRSDRVALPADWPARLRLPSR